MNPELHVPLFLLLDLLACCAIVFLLTRLSPRP